MDRFELRAPIEVDESLSPFKEGLECFLLNRPMIRSVGYLPLYRLWFGRRDYSLRRRRSLWSQEGPREMPIYISVARCRTEELEVSGFEQLGPTKTGAKLASREWQKRSCARNKRWGETVDVDATRYRRKGTELIAGRGLDRSLGSGFDSDGTLPSTGPRTSTELSLEPRILIIELMQGTQRQRCSNSGRRAAATDRDYHYRLPEKKNDEVESRPRPQCGCRSYSTTSNVTEYRRADGSRQMKILDHDNERLPWLTPFVVRHGI